MVARHGDRNYGAKVNTTAMLRNIGGGILDVKGENLTFFISEICNKIAVPASKR